MTEETDLPSEASLPAVGKIPTVNRIILSNGKFEDEDFRHRHFKDLNGSKSTFVKCDFSYCIFERAYFHGAKFDDCDFTGSRFYESNFRGASLHRCEFRYALFYRTLLEAKEIIASLPLEPNLSRDLLQNLRANAAAIGDHRSQRSFVLREIDANRDYWRRAMRAEQSYYIKKFPTLYDRIRAGGHLAWLNIGGLIWGHGERPLRVLASGITFLLTLSLINLWAVIPKVGWERSEAGLLVLKHSLDVFFGISTDQSFSGFIIIDYVLVVLLFLYIGLFISILLKSVSHR